MATRVRVAWCPDCLVYLGPEEVGNRCPMDDCPRKLRLRVGYICPDCSPENNLYFARRVAQQHDTMEFSHAGN